jgi:cyclopropane-fatty-acyl-phospholipid synthase
MIDTTARPAPSETAEATLAFLRDLFSGYSRDFAVRLWDGTLWAPDAGREPRFTVVLRHPGAARAMFWPPGQLTLSEAYFYDDFDIEGDLEAVFPLVDYLLEREPRLTEWLRALRRLRTLPSERRPRIGSERAQLRGRRSSLERDREAIAHHYDVSNEFFALWLDPTMTYSCALFESAEEGLDAAQRRKLHYVCRKLRLQPGERLLDIGCGWGGLVLHAASHFGVEAVGITLSEAQVEFASMRIQEAGLSDRCRVELCDYRELDEPGRFDKLASIGMYEHVGRHALDDYFRAAWRLLKPKGVFLAHGIASSAETLPRAGPSFLTTYALPDVDLPPVSTVLTASERARFEVRDLESLREHYVLTARTWLKRLETRREDARQLTSEAAYRVWRLTLAAFAHRLASGSMNVYQALLAKPDNGVTGLPLSRADWYT